jgi:hypothetical protein
MIPSPRHHTHLPNQQDLHPLHPHHSRQYRGRCRVRRPERGYQHRPLDRQLRLDLPVADSRACCSGPVARAQEAQFLLVRVRRGNEPDAQRHVCESSVWTESAVLRGVR